MQNRVWSITLVLSILNLFAGCMSNSSGNSKVSSPLVWTDEGIKQERMTIALGFRSNAEASDQSIEPIAAITRDGTPIANAMVFCSLVSAEDGKAIGEETATVYEPALGSAPALYAQGKLNLPDNNATFAVRFRIIFPDSDQDWTREIKLPPK